MSEPLQSESQKPKDTVLKPDLAAIPNSLPKTSPDKPRSNKRLFILLWVFIILLLIVISVFLYFSNRNRNKGSVGLEAINNNQLINTNSPALSAFPSPTTDVSQSARINTSPVFMTSIDPNIDYEVIIKQNPLDQLKSDIFLADPITQAELHYMTVSEIHQRHYHNGEYHNGNIYLIHRTGGSDGPQTNPNWTDELWKYDLNKNSKFIFSVQGLDFRVSGDERFTTIMTNDFFYLLDSTGKKLKTFSDKDIKIFPDKSPLYGFTAWGTDEIWLSNAFGPNINALVKISLINYSITQYDLSNLQIGSEYDYNPSSQKLVFSTYPAIYDSISFDEYIQSGSKVSLFLYDLNDKTKTQIAEAITKRFNPVWVNENTLEYNNPLGENKISKIFP